MSNTNKPHNYISQIGKTFNFWTVLDDSIRKFQKVYWTCVCVCGVERTIAAQSVKSGKSSSCGCSKGASYTLNNQTANGKFPAEYSSWVNMRQRCNNPKNTAYKYYGGKGISVCKRWDSSFANFLKDMGPAPDGKNTIDRIDNSKGYEPSNCRWASMQEQTKNRSWSAPQIPRERDEKGRYK